MIVQAFRGWTDCETAEHIRSRFGMDVAGQVIEALIAAHQEGAVPTASATEQPPTDPSLAIAFPVKILWRFMDSAATAIVQQWLKLCLRVFKLHAGLHARMEPRVRSA